MYGTLIINDNIQNSISLLKSYQNKIDKSGNIFVLVRNEVDDIGDVVCDFFDVIHAATQIGYLYINTIVVPTKIKNAVDLPDNVLYIVWLAKEKNHFFNKDVIRENHIWKDVEWGKRTKNYNPKGKDPGNVWIPTKDDGKAHITEHILLTTSDVINRIYSCSAQPKLSTLLLTNTKPDGMSLPDSIIVEYLPSSIKTVCNTTYNPKQPLTETDNRVGGTVVWGTSEQMNSVPDNSVNVVITSPPYWDLKDYFKKGQIGQEPYEIYLDRLFNVWRGCYEKLVNDGSLWININIRTKNGKAVLMPWDFIRQCKKIGFHYKGVLIWHKSSGIPTHDKNIVDRHEYVLIFSKSERLNINSRICEYGDYKNSCINGGLFWNINRKAGSVGKHFIHPAIYPNELVSRIVEVTTCQNDMVLDPFLGSGTTLIASVLSGRNCIGYEYNEGFKELISSRYNSEVHDKSIVCNM